MCSVVQTEKPIAISSVHEPEFTEDTAVKAQALRSRFPWLVWLSGLSASLQTKGLLVRFPGRTHAWVGSQVPQ